MIKFRHIEGALYHAGNEGIPSTKLPYTANIGSLSSLTCPASPVAVTPSKAKAKYDGKCEATALTNKMRILVKCSVNTTITGIVSEELSEKISELEEPA